MAPAPGYICDMPAAREPGNGNMPAKAGFIAKAFAAAKGVVAAFAGI